MNIAEMLVRQAFRDMGNKNLSSRSIILYLEQIDALIKSGQTSLTKCRLTEKGLNNQLRRSLVKSSEQAYKKMSSKFFSTKKIEDFAEDILHLVAKGYISWEDLSFTREDVVLRLRQVKAREITKKYAMMLDKDLTIPRVSELRNEILDLTKDDCQIWVEASLTEHDVTARLHHVASKVTLTA